MVREVKDPRIGFATITRVQVTPDLHHARVYVSILGTPEEQKASLDGLSSAAGFLRHEVAHQLDMRRTPELSFTLDQGADAVERIDALLQKFHKNEE
jgi:ribosome-binding factor A